MNHLLQNRILGLFTFDPETKTEGIEILNSVIKSEKLNKEDKKFITEILENYEK